MHAVCPPRHTASLHDWLTPPPPRRTLLYCLLPPSPMPTRLVPCTPPARPCPAPPPGPLPQAMADTVAAYFVPCIVALSALVFAGWMAAATYLIRPEDLPPGVSPALLVRACPLARPPARARIPHAGGHCPATARVGAHYLGRGPGGVRGAGRGWPGSSPGACAARHA